MPYRRARKDPQSLVHCLFDLVQRDRHPLPVDRLPVHPRRRRLGKQRPRRLGLAHRQLRILGRYRPRRDIDLRNPVPLPSAVANEYQSVCRSHDHLRRVLRRHLSWHPCRARMVCLLAGSLPKSNGNVAKFPQPPAVGRFCCQYLRNGFGPVLVFRNDPRFGHASRPRHEQVAQTGLRRGGTRMARVGQTVAPLRAGVPVPGRSGDSPGS